VVKRKLIKEKGVLPPLVSKAKTPQQIKEFLEIVTEKPSFYYGKFVGLETKPKTFHAYLEQLKSLQTPANNQNRLKLLRMQEIRPYLVDKNSWAEFKNFVGNLRRSGNIPIILDTKKIQLPRDYIRLALDFSEQPYEKLPVYHVNVGQSPLNVWLDHPRWLNPVVSDLRSFNFFEENSFNPSINLDLWEDSVRLMDENSLNTRITYGQPRLVTLFSSKISLKNHFCRKGEDKTLRNAMKNATKAYQVMLL
jgi:hypothetical protein